MFDFFAEYSRLLGNTGFWMYVQQSALPAVSRRDEPELRLLAKAKIFFLEPKLRLTMYEFL